MKLSEFDFDLPKELIAQEPIEPRDHSRLLILNKDGSELKHEYFYNLPDYLQPGDLLIVNNSRVFPARLFGEKEITGGRMEIFLHQRKQDDAGDEIWECLIGGRGAKPGLKILISDWLSAEVAAPGGDGTWLVRFSLSGKEFFEHIGKVGHVPLPPYIKRDKDREADKERYQTVYAELVGSAAAPTAGLHFTDRLLSEIKEKGIEIQVVTLHVGLGTFAPVKTENIEDHKIHSEHGEISAETMSAIRRAKKEERRVVAVGTTSARVLEGLAWQNIHNEKGASGMISIFIYPGYEFKVVDALVTNFHLPKSSLLMLVSALAGKGNIDKAYQEAIKSKYRFFSYGDAMFII